jgi:inner membrane protein
MYEKNEMSAWDRVQKFLRESATIKLLIIGFILLLLLIPLSFVRDLVHERQYRQSEAMSEVSRTWGEAQTVTGPFITLPYQSAILGNNGERIVSNSKSFYHLLPEKLDIQTELKTEKRSRGIFEVIVYTSEVTISGFFKQPDLNALQANSYLLPTEATVALGISDLHNLGDLMELQWGASTLSMAPGVENAELVQSGVSSSIDLNSTMSSGDIPFRIKFNLRGSDAIHFLPFGKETNVHMAGNWSSPSFQGAFFPTHQVNENGFTADWKVIFLNRNYPQIFSGVPEGIGSSSFGMQLYVPVTEYQKNERAAKYAVLIIALTFMVFFFVQILNHVRLHGLQFILVGLALCLFYVLLLSFTEHIGFNWAYLISGAMTIGLVAFYVSAIFKRRRLSMFNLIFLILVYGFVFVIIQMEEYSLLVGGLGLFMVLAAAMYLSRNINYSLSGAEKEISG